MSRPARASTLALPRSPVFLRFLALSGLTLLICLLSAHAFAATVVTADDTVKRIGNNAVTIPQLAAVVSYVIGVWLTFNGLLKFRLWIDDSNRNTLNAALYRIVVGAFMIALPHIFIVVNNTLFGSQGTLVAGENIIKPPRLFAFDK